MNGSRNLGRAGPLRSVPRSAGSSTAPADADVVDVPVVDVPVVDAPVVDAPRRQVIATVAAPAPVVELKTLALVGVGALVLYWLWSD